MLAVLVAVLGSAGSQVSPIDAELIQDWRRSREFTLAVAEAMPADKYGFKLDSEEMPYASLMIHIAVAQAYRFSQISGKPLPFQIPTSIDKNDAKEVCKRLLAQSFDFCIRVLTEITADQLERLYNVDWYGRPKLSGRELIFAMFAHTVHHRGQAEVYLRANGIRPPPYRF